MRLPLLLLLVVPGLILLAGPALPLGLGMIAFGVWFYERPGGRGDEAFTGLLMVLGGLGALALVAQFIWQRITG
jgi:hypothetical protein